MAEPYILYSELYEDDRGSVYCTQDNMHEFPKVKRTYVVKNWSKGLIRAWHGHKKAWTGIHVIKGAAKIAAKPIGIVGTAKNDIDVRTFVLSDRKPGIVWIPPGWYNGAMSLEDDTRLLVYSTLSFDEVKKDDVRLGLTDRDVQYVFGVKNR